MPGYVTPGVSAGANASSDQFKRLLAALPTVHVAAGQVASVNLTLRPGASISGRVQFADGSPAVGWSVSWELAEQNLAIKAIRLARPTAQQDILLRFDYLTEHRPQVTTDQEGRYRLFGLQPGNYIVKTVIASQYTSEAQLTLSDGSSPNPSRMSSEYPQWTIVYGPGVFRRGDARVIPIHGSELVSNADVKIDSTGLHAVRGRVLAGEDRHVPSEAILWLRAGGGKDFDKTASVAADGSFDFDYLPPGHYALELFIAMDQAAPTTPGERPQQPPTYKMAKLDVVVDGHDVALHDILLTALKPGETWEMPE